MNKPFRHMSWLLALLVSAMSGFCSFSSAVFAQDTILNRSVTVEREFHPIIQSAGKLTTTPAALEPSYEPAQVTYSDYTEVLAPSFNTTSLLSQTQRFTAPKPLHGYIRGALGHPWTQFDFTYRVDDGKNSIVDLFAHHNAQWGSRTISATNLGFDFQHPFSRATVYMDLKGANLFYTMPGKDDSRQISWEAEFKLGVKAAKKEDFQYDVSVGYFMIHLPAVVDEHQLRTHIHLEYAGSAHHGGIHIALQNNFILPDEVAWQGFQNTYILSTGRPEQTHNHRHSLKMEPFYAYYGRRFTIHAGVNVDLVFGKGSLMTNNQAIALAPSPNIRFEGQKARFC